MLRVRTVLSCLTVIFLVSTAARSAPDGELSLAKGTSVALRLLTAVSSESAKIGDPVTFEAAEDVKVDGIVIIPKGSEAHGFVTEATSSKLWGSGRIAVYAGDVKTRTGFSVPIHAALSASNGRAEAVLAPHTRVVAETDLSISFDASLYESPDAKAATN